VSNDLQIPVAQYLRMSTEHQQFSIDNQAQVIGRYAENHGFSVVHTYSDSARSGLVLKGRPALRILQTASSTSCMHGWANASVRKSICTTDNSGARSCSDSLGRGSSSAQASAR
jgi:hypothetical protein